MFRERGREREKKPYQFTASHTHPAEDQTHNLDTCPDQESHPQIPGI